MSKNRRSTVLFECKFLVFEKIVIGFGFLKKEWFLVVNIAIMINFEWLILLLEKLFVKIVSGGKCVYLLLGGGKYLLADISAYEKCKFNTHVSEILIDDENYVLVACC